MMLESKVADGQLGAAQGMQLTRRIAWPRKQSLEEQS